MYVYDLSVAFLISKVWWVVSLALQLSTMSSIENSILLPLLYTALQQRLKDAPGKASAAISCD